MGYAKPARKLRGHISIVIVIVIVVVIIIIRWALFAKACIFEACILVGAVVGWFGCCALLVPTSVGSSGQYANRNQRILRS
jgi:hypothetical protein